MCMCACVCVCLFACLACGPCDGVASPARAGRSGGGIPLLPLRSLRPVCVVALPKQRSSGVSAPTGRMDSAALQKELFDYEGRVRVEKHAREVAARNAQYISEHPEITPVLHDILQHLLIHKPEEPLAAIQDYARARLPPARRRPT
ncbi:uncharacterized protein Tco025E_00406 [Trypanosoma conorhini]|uniref:Uncharacterized protein n=1 Tax=Trypanosoma conorhini TaxID=83891 RepID=A0A3R7LFF4_9TRYP|nr:uncharacterized protein Tco025E_00406 [Trypanosoma conorhini]RNF27336.1 hypothetical protein Tco025E_00406 [Trypanosoma conorhini]